MKVHAYTDISILFGRASCVWMDTLSDHFESWEGFGIEPGVHRAMAVPENMPLVCAELPADTLRREATEQAAWQGRMLSMIESVA